MYPQPHPQQFGPMNMMYPYPMYTPKKECTLYVGDLDEQITEEVLYQYFARFGSIATARVMKHSQTKKSRGFGFLSFFQQQDAENARISSNHQVIIRKPIRVTIAKSPREFAAGANVFIKKIPEGMDINDIDSHFSQFGRVFTSKINTDDEGNSLGYGYVQFEEKEEADKALESTADGIVKINELEIEILRFKKKDEREGSDVRNNIYLKNFPEDLDETNLEEKLKVETSLKIASIATIRRNHVFVGQERQEDQQAVCLCLLQDS